jgi:hypothetical protein
MSDDRNNKMEHSELTALEERIRQMSTPEVPSDLEAKLIAAIPVMKGRAVVRSWSGWRWPAVAACAAAAVVVLALTFGRAPTREVPNLASDAAQRILGDTSPRRVLGEGFKPVLEETGPCDIELVYPGLG